MLRQSTEAFIHSICVKGPFMALVNAAISPHSSYHPWDEVTLTVPFDESIDEFIIKFPERMEAKLAAVTSCKAIQFYIENIDLARLLYEGKELIEYDGTSKTLLDIGMQPNAVIDVPGNAALEEVVFAFLKVEQEIFLLEQFGFDRIEKHEALILNYHVARLLDLVGLEMGWPSVKRIVKFLNIYYSRELGLAQMIGSLNKIQQDVIEATVQFPLDDITNTLKADLDLSIKVLKAIFDPALLSQEELKFLDSAEIKVLDSIQMIREILTHPCPQNRSASLYPGMEHENFVIFKVEKENIHDVTNDCSLILKNCRAISQSDVLVNDDHESFIIAKEQKGLLGLTAREDNDTGPVSKTAVTVYVRKMLLQALRNEEKKRNKEKIIIHINSTATQQPLFTLQINPYLCSMGDFVHIFSEKLFNAKHFSVEKGKPIEIDYDFIYQGKILNADCLLVKNSTFAQFIKQGQPYHDFKSDCHISVEYHLSPQLRVSPVRLSKLCLFKLKEMKENEKPENPYTSSGKNF